MASIVSQRALLVWSTLAVASGCGQILGISSYDIDPALDGKGVGESGAAGEDNGGSSTTGGTNQGGKPSTGGSTNDAGQGGDAAGTSGRGGSGTTGGTAGAGEGGGGGDGGDGGSPPDSKFKGCDGTPFTGNEAIVRSCILRVGCMAWNYPTDTISRCVSQNTQNTYEGTKCTLDAQTCDDITECEGTHLETDFCDGKDDGQYCNGNEVVNCGLYPWAQDCTKYGGTCHDFGHEVGGTDNTVDCALPNVTACTATDEVEACGGPGNAYKYQCDGTVAYGIKCSNFAASCQSLDSDIGCYYPLNTCTTESVSCANNRATWCDGTTRAVYDCGSVGLGCSTQGDYYDDNGRQCSAPGCTPEDVLDCQETCSDDGEHLTFCYGGSKVTVDCKDYGFTGCYEYDYPCDGGTMNDCLYTSDTIHFADCE